MLTEIAGTRLNSSLVLPAAGTRGGVLLAWDAASFQIDQIDLSAFAVTALVTPLVGGEAWTLTTVYGPSKDAAKPLFLADLAQIRGLISGPWLLIGDFNLIYEARDKSNSNLNLRLMARFRSALNSSDLKEINLCGRRFTWSNEHASPTLVRMDRAFCTLEWDLQFSTARLQPLATAMSDHCPLLLTCESSSQRSARFRFEAFWPHVSGFKEVVAAVWNAPGVQGCALARLDAKLKRAARALHLWHKHHIGNTRLQLLMAQDTVLMLDHAQEDRQLELDELICTKSSSRAFLVSQLSSASRPGSAPESGKFELHHKEQIATEFFDRLLGDPGSVSTGFNWDALDLPRANLDDLEAAFTREEIAAAIADLPPDRAPGPDGFPGAFYKAAAEIILDDLVLAFQQLHCMNRTGLHLFNGAHVVLLAKKDGASSMADYRPISLLHSVAKLFSKVLAMRLAKRIDTLISPTQSAFIKGRCIQDNFIFVQGMARHFHRTKRAAILLKLDIAKAFDTVSWPYPLDMMRARGFGSRWCNWITMLLATSSSRVLVNGALARSIRHHRGLRQGDSISPFLFILAMEPLQRLLDQGDSISPFLFILAMEPLQRLLEFSPIRQILQAFGQATGLQVNFSKSKAIPIRPELFDVDDIIQPLGAARATLLCCFLGLPLSLRKVRKAELQPLLDKILARLAAWKFKLFTAADRLVLLNSVISALVVYWLSVHQLPAWVRRQIDKIRRAWLWRGQESCPGGHCKVAWGRICRPKELGGLGIIDLDRFGIALRLRWLWWEKTTPYKPWIGLPVPCNEDDRWLFAAATTVALGDGRTTSFWMDSWLQGQAPCHIAPELFRLSKRKHRTVRQALTGNRWLEASGSYSASSAYHLQFLGSTFSPIMQSVWHARVPAKIKFFSWLLSAGGLLTADRLMARAWPNSYFCLLCWRNLETAQHLFRECTWSRNLWTAAASRFRVPTFLPSSWRSSKCMVDWLDGLITVPVGRKRARSIALLITWWIWLERNGRIFMDLERPVRVVLELLTDELATWVLSGGNHLMLRE
ncbi:uncharacterized protein [Aegilops tauschii subsp. strangulata]|uniref:uncharacterized protein n=1 Tax=Aegilops tauschii subsp. strangulata TaxID=200361 RepID=UPI003CC8A3D5